MFVVFMKIPQEEWNALSGTAIVRRHDHRSFQVQEVYVFLLISYENLFSKTSFQNNVPKWNTFAS